MGVDAVQCYFGQSGLMSETCALCGVMPVPQQVSEISEPCGEMPTLHKHVSGLFGLEPSQMLGGLGSLGSFPV